MKKFFNIGLFVILGIGIGLIIGAQTVKEKIVKIEIPESLIIQIPQKYNLTGTEYTKRILNDITITSYNNHANQTDDRSIFSR